MPSFHDDCYEHSLFEPIRYLDEVEDSTEKQRYIFMVIFGVVVSEMCRARRNSA